MGVELRQSVGGFFLGALLGTELELRHLLNALQLAGSVLPLARRCMNQQ